MRQQGELEKSTERQQILSKIKNALAKVRSENSQLLIDVLSFKRLKMQHLPQKFSC